MGACTAKNHGDWRAYRYGCRCPEARESRRLFVKRWREGRLQTNKVDPTATRRRVHALVAIGWPMSVLSFRLGFTNRSSLRKILESPQFVQRASAEKIAALYDELSMIPGPSEVAITRARAKGWAPPLAWDDETIGNPMAQPEWGWTLPTVEPMMRAERIAAVRQMTAKGDSLRTIAQTLGLTERQVSRYRKELK